MEGTSISVKREESLSLSQLALMDQLLMVLLLSVSTAEGPLKSISIAPFLHCERKEKEVYD